MGPRRPRVSVTEKLQTAQFVVDADGTRRAVILDYALWEELLSLLEDAEDALEIDHLREAGEEAIPWEQAKAELQAERVDV
jgi:hypothetical protein